MPSRFRLRRVFKPVVVLVAKGLVKVGMSPNQATYVVLFLSLISMIYLLFAPSFYPWIAGFGALIFIVGIMDGVDGSIARLTGKASRKGGILDSTLDRISDGLIFIAPGLRDLLAGDLVSSSWLIVPGISVVPVWFWCFLSFVGAYMTSYIRARATLAEKVIDTDVGLMGRSERLFTLVIFTLLNAIPTGIVILALASNLTAGWRLSRVKAQLNRTE